MQMKARGLFLTAMGVVAMTILPRAAHCQGSEMPLAIGDSVKFAISGDNWSGAWTGSVYEVKNQRNCFFVVHSRILDGDMFSFGMRFPDDFKVTKYLPDGGIEEISAAELREHGIECVETHPTPERTYLLPDSSSEGA